MDEGSTIGRRNAMKLSPMARLLLVRFAWFLRSAEGKSRGALVNSGRGSSYAENTLLKGK
jgi:hypothetical protein